MKENGLDCNNSIRRWMQSSYFSLVGACVALSGTHSIIRQSSILQLSDLLSC